MLKAKALELLGGTVAGAARELGISYQAVYKWPDVLPREIEDRIVAAVARKRVPAEMRDVLGEEPQLSSGEQPKAA